MNESWNLQRFPRGCFCVDLRLGERVAHIESSPQPTANVCRRLNGSFRCRYAVTARWKVIFKRNSPFQVAGFGIVVSRSFVETFAEVRTECKWSTNYRWIEERPGIFPVVPLVSAGLLSCVMVAMLLAAHVIPKDSDQLDEEKSSTTQLSQKSSKSSVYSYWAYD